MKLGRTLAGVCILGFSLVQSIGAYSNSKQKALPNFDKRPRQQPAAEAAAEQRLAPTRLQERAPGIKVEFDDVVGTPRLITSPNGFLTGPEGKGGTIGAATLEAFPANDPHRVIKSFLRQHAQLFGHGPEVLAAARTLRDDVTAHSGLRTVIWEQQLDDIAVFEGRLIGHITKRGELVNLSSRFIPGLAEAANKGTADRTALVARPVISAPEAIVLAAANIGDKVLITDVVPLAQDAEGAEKRQRFRADPLKGETRVRLIWLPMNRSSLRLCWQVELASRARGELYRVLIDAQAGDALIRHCLTLYLSEATYRVFVSDSPTPFSPGYRTPSSDQPSVVERRLVTLSALSTNASPNGWINDGGNELRGNNVDAHLDRNDDDQADLPRLQGAPPRVFDFPMDLDKAPASYGNATVTQLFYWNNWMHDKLYELGFTEAAGNFQKTNFDRGGVGNDAVEADAQDGGGFNNSNFSASSDGIPGRMQMYIFDGATPDRDGSLDAEIVLHEYTHGLSTRLVGGGDQLNELQSAGMGEGWSDFYALALLSESGDELDGNYAMGAYASYQFGQLKENYYYGIRRYPYTTDLARNPLTFKDLDSRQADRHAGVPLSPLSGAGDFAEEVHNQGEVWCVTLWEARVNLIKKWGFEVGNQLSLQLVMDGMKLTPPNPNFLEARDAILQADLVKTGGANREELWAAFAKRGMGFNANSPRSSTTSGVSETFDVPDDLQIAPASGLTSTGPDGGPFSPANQTYSLSNVGTNVVDWSATWTAAWLELSITNGILQPGAAPITLTVQLNSIVNSLPSGLYDDTITFTNRVSGKSQARKIALRVGQPDYFTRFFADADNDLDFQTITFTPDGSKDYYSVCRETAIAFPTDPSAGAVLSLADDDFAKVVLSDGAHVSLYGTNYTSFYVSANGSVTFTQGVSEFQESIEAHFSLPRISMLFDDLDPSFDGLVSWTQLPDLVAVTFENVPNFFEANQNSFQLEMFFDGRIRLTYLEIGSTGGLIGLSNGKGLPAGFVETNFKSYGACLPVLSVNLPASVTEGQPDVTGTVVLPQPLTSDLVVSLQSSDRADLTVPASLTIPRGETVGQFPLGVADDNELNGTRAARISASAEGFRDGTARIQIYDNETGRLTVELPHQANEGDGLLRGQARVTLDLPATKNVVIGLSSSDTTEIETPKIVVIPAGQTSATFDLTVVDDLEIDGPSIAVVTAHVENWQDGSASMAVLDNERKEITVSLKRYAGEGNGLLKDAGTVQIPGTLADDLTVSLAASDASELTVPGVVVIPKNQTTAKFDLTIIDDPEVDGPQTVSVTASAAGFSSGTASLIVNDNETPPIPVAPFPANLSTNNSPTVTLSWSTGEGETLVNGGFESGDFSEWVRVNSDTGGFVINDGTLDPDGPENPVPPLTGRFAAVSQQTGAGRNVIYQEVTISAGAISATLSWSDRIRNQASIFVDPDQEFRVEIRSTDDQVLAIAYSTNPGDMLLNDWTNRSFDLADFVGQTIRIAFVEEDSLGFFNVHLDSISVVLGESGPTTYDVFFGPKPEIGINDFQGRVATNRFDLDKLYIDATYYWQVVAKRGTAQAIGPVWQFSVPGVGPVDHFGWNAVASPQTLDQPFPVTVVAQDVFDNTVTNFDGVVSLSGRVEFPDTTIGAGIESWDFPLGGFFPESRIQVIYPVSEVGSARRITSLAVYVSNTRVLPVTRFTIRMKHTSLLSYTAAPPSWERTGWTTVYQKNQPVNDRGWVVFELTTPFDYDGTSSLMIDFSYKGTGFSPGGQCRYSVTSEPRSISYESFGEFGDPLIWTGSTSPPPDVDSKAPDILLTAVNPVAITPLSSGNFTNGVWTGEVTVQELVARLALRSDDGEGHFGTGNIFDLQARDDLSLAVSDSPDPVTAGQDIVYTFLVSNSGPSLATGVVLSNALPANLSLVSATSSQGTFIGTNPAVVCDLGTLPGGSNAVVTVVMNSGSFTGSVTNVVQVTRNESEQYLLNNLSAAVTIVVPRPSISIDDVTVAEGNSGTTNAEFTVRLSGPGSQVITVLYATTDDTAQEKSDYIGASGVLTFQPGVTSQKLVVQVKGDTEDEPDEQFFLTLSSPQNASLTRAQGTASILDDDGPVISIFDVSVAEGNRATTNAVFSLLLDRPSVQPVSVEYATSNGSAASGSDYVETNGIVSFAPGATNGTITVVVNGDTLVEPNERFFLNLFNPINATIADQQAVGTIVNDDGLPGNIDRFEWTAIASPQTVNQPFAVTVMAMDAFSRPATNFSGIASLRGEIVYPDANIGDGEVPWSEPLGTFFEDSRVQIIYLAGEVGAPRLITALAIHVTAVPALTLNRWTIRMKHTSLSSYGPAPSWERTGWTIVYQNNETLTATGWIIFQFTKPFDYNGVDNLMIDFSFNNSDFAFPEGECTATETANARSLWAPADSDFGDPLNWTGNNPEPAVENQILNIRLSSHVPVGVGPTNSDRFVGGIWTGKMTVEELVTGMVLSADDEEGHLGQSNPFDIGVFDDLSVTVTDVPDPVTVGRPLTYNVTIHNSGPSLSSGVILTNALPAGVAFVSAVSDQGVCFETNGIVVCDLGAVPGGTNVSVIIVVNSPADATVLTNRASVTRNEVDPYFSNNVALTPTRVNNRPSISISDATVMEGDSGTTGAILMASLSVSSSETVTVDYATADGTAEQGTDYVAAGGTITFPPGTTNQPVTVQIVGDTNDELEETLFVNLSNPVNATIGNGQGICRIIDDDGPAISINKINVTEGNSGTNNAVFTVKLSAASPQTVTVEYATADDSAIAGSDYLEAAGELTFTPGVTNLNVTIRIKGDIAFEPDEDFFVNLFNPTNATVLVSPGIGTILNDDGLAGELDHFEWSTISSPQRVNQPFTTVLFARDALNQPGLNFTGTAQLEAATRNPDLTIGTGTTTWSAPLDTSYEMSRVQVIYLAEEVGSARRVTALALNVTAIPLRALNRWTIRMRHTALNTYGTRPVWERTGWTTVYQQDQTVEATGWTTFTFTRPFDFNGTNNLMVDFSFKNDDFDFNGGECLSSDTPDARSLSYGTFGFFGSTDDPLTWSGTLPQPDVNLLIPDIRLSTITPVRITPTNSAAFVDGSWSGTLAIDTPATNVIIRATDVFGHTGESASFAVSQWIDTDADGLPDDWELANRFDPADGRDAIEDADGDGLSNAEEYSAGTDPHDPASSLRIGFARINDAGAVLSFESVLGKVYRIESSTQIGGAVWSVVKNDIPGIGQTVEVTDPEPLGQSNRFYRLRVIP